MIDRDALLAKITDLRRKTSNRDILDICDALWGLLLVEDKAVDKSKHGPYRGQVMPRLKKPKEQKK